MTVKNTQTGGAVAAAMAQTQSKIRYSDAELDEFRVLVLSKIEKAKNELEALKESQSNPNGTDDTNPTWKTFEEGQSTSFNEENGRMISRQMKFISCLESALIRIQNKTYGICRETGKLIPKERLRAVPHATLCLESKEEEARKKKSNHSGGFLNFDVL